MLNRQGCPNAVAAVLAVSLLTACSTTAPEYSAGYDVVQLSPNLYRVSFSGSSAASRNEVENSLLQRAAEVTLQAGHTHFAFYRRDGDPYLLGPYYYAYLPYAPFRTGQWSTYPWGENLRPATSYSVYTEIKTLSSDEAARHPDAMDAVATLRSLLAPPPSSFASAAPPP